MSVFLLPSKLVDAIEKWSMLFDGVMVVTRDVGLRRYGLFWSMSFKDLTSFNVAMLGKQGWRLQTDPTSLVSHLFEARL